MFSPGSRFKGKANELKKIKGWIETILVQMVPKNQTLTLELMVDNGINFKVGTVNIVGQSLNLTIVNSRMG